MIFVEPEKRVGDQEIAHFVAAIIKNERAPILVLALARIHVFVEIGAIELGQAVRIFWKMRRHPIHDHADADLMAFVDEVTKLIGCTEPARRRVIIRDLISPRAFKRMFGYGQKLNVGVAHLDYVRQQRLG